MVLQEKMKTVEVGLDSGHLRIAPSLLPSPSKRHGFQPGSIWLWEADSACGSMHVEHVTRLSQLPWV